MHNKVFRQIKNSETKSRICGVERSAIFHYMPNMRENKKNICKKFFKKNMKIYVR